MLVSFILLLARTARQEKPVSSRQLAFEQWAGQDGADTLMTVVVDKELVSDSGSIFIVRMAERNDSDTMFMLWAMTEDSAAYSQWWYFPVGSGTVNQMYMDLLEKDSLPSMFDEGKWWRDPRAWDPSVSAREETEVYLIPIPRTP